MPNKRGDHAFRGMGWGTAPRKREKSEACDGSIAFLVLQRKIARSLCVSLSKYILLPRCFASHAVLSVGCTKANDSLPETDAIDQQYRREAGRPRKAERFSGPSAWARAFAERFDTGRVQKNFSKRGCSAHLLPLWGLPDELLLLPVQLFYHPLHLPGESLAHRLIDLRKTRRRKRTRAWTGTTKPAMILIPRLSSSGLACAPQPAGGAVGGRTVELHRGATQRAQWRRRKPT